MEVRVDLAKCLSGEPGGVFIPAAGVINILDAEHQFGIMLFRPLLAYQRRVGIAYMQQTCGAGCKTGSEFQRSAGWSGNVFVMIIL